MNSSTSGSQRTIRSFIRRQGRITPGQQHAIDSYWDKYCLAPGVSYDYAQEFGRNAPLLIEIGFGNGECLASMATANPDKDYIGIEVHKPGVGHLLMQLEQQNLNNVRIYCHDAVEVLNKNIPDNSLNGVHLFFPDPWPKKKHHKRRIVSTEFVALIAAKLKRKGYFHVATDWENYAEHMLGVLLKSNQLSNASNLGGYSKRPEYRTLTKFEQRGIRLGHGVWDLIFNK